MGGRLQDWRLGIEFWAQDPKSPQELPGVRRQDVRRELYAHDRVRSALHFASFRRASVCFASTTAVSLPTRTATCSASVDLVACVFVRLLGMADMAGRAVTSPLHDATRSGYVGTRSVRDSVCKGQGQQG